MPLAICGWRLRSRSGCGHHCAEELPDRARQQTLAARGGRGLAASLLTGKRHIHKVIVLNERRHGEKLCNEPQSREVIMPTERESIEAELRERERLITKCLEVLEGIKDLEADLERLEAEHGLPKFYRSKPLIERLAHLGMSQDAINDIKELLDAMSAIPSVHPARGEPNGKMEFPHKWHNPKKYQHF
jgi:hypothetical protein